MAERGGGRGAVGWGAVKWRPGRGYKKNRQAGKEIVHGTTEKNKEEVEEERNLCQDLAHDRLSFSSFILHFKKNQQVKTCRSIRHAFASPCGWEKCTDKRAYGTLNGNHLN